MRNRSPSVARQYASIILLVGMVTAAIAAIVTFNGDPTLGLQICAGGMVVAVVILLFGGLIVAASQKGSGDDTA